MRVLYIGSKADEASSLNLEREITELQRRFTQVRGERVDFAFLPRVLAEELPSEIMKGAPEILHLSAHGANDNLALANEAGSEIRITASALNSYFSRDDPPRLVYVNACDSQSIARDLTDKVPMAIGMTAPISNRAARTAAVLFYGHLLEGASVADAFEAARATIEALQSSTASAALHVRLGVDPKTEYFHRVPRIIARFKGNKAEAWKGRFAVVAGVSGCPSITTQVIISTDDIGAVGEAKAVDANTRLESVLCRISRTRPIKGLVWLDDGQAWDVGQDCNLAASIMTSEGRMLSISATPLTVALHTNYQTNTNPKIAEALNNLRNT
ncbi:CHAT domain-containing protein [Caballeronia grimmiae]|uniref:CHAT domain-containing protein n=1 Tax=Caballeronia grimmiae TaxID=1071679 RepID=UPI0038B9AFA1